jgi:hypothetical protein
MRRPTRSLLYRSRRGYGRTVEAEAAIDGGQKPSGKRRRPGLAPQQRVYNLVRVARAFPPEQRDEYADRPWGWFLESVRERHPQAAAERYAGLSIGWIKNLWKNNQISREQITI